MVDSLEREIQGLRALLHTDRDPQGRAFVPLADAYRRARDLERALEVVSIGLERHPELASAYVVEAWVQQDRGDPNGAAAAWERVLELDPDNIEALHGLGSLLAAAGRAARAEPLLERARALDPDRARPSATLPATEISAASPEIDASDEAGTDELPALEDGGLVAFETGEPDEPQELPATRTLAELYARQGLHGRAAEVYERLSKERPDDADLRRRLAELRAGGSATRATALPTSVHDEDTETLARELASPPTASDQSDTLFAWGRDEPADSPTPERAPTVGAYFRELLSWSRVSREVAAATDAPVPVGHIVTIESLAPVIVAIESLAPDGAVPVDELAPSAVPIEMLAPHRGPAFPSSS